MDDLTRELIYQWRGRAKNLSTKGLEDDYIFFFIYYLCLDAWITNESGKSNEKEKKKWLIENGGELKSAFIENRFDKSDLVKLKTFSPILNMGPGHSGKVELTDIENFRDVVNFIYQIRCNLFHGSKDPGSGRNKDIVSFASSFLKKWIESAQTKDLIS